MTRKEFINDLISRHFEPFAVVSCADLKGGRQMEIQPLNRLILGNFDHVVAEYRTPAEVFDDRRREFDNEYDIPLGKIIDKISLFELYSHAAEK